MQKKLQSRWVSKSELIKIENGTACESFTGSFYVIGNSYCIKSINAPLAEVDFALQAPLARREFASKLFFKN